MVQISIVKKKKFIELLLFWTVNITYNYKVQQDYTSYGPREKVDNMNTYTIFRFISFPRPPITVYECYCRSRNNTIVVTYIMRKMYINIPTILIYVHTTQYAYTCTNPDMTERIVLNLPRPILELNPIRTICYFWEFDSVYIPAIKIVMIIILLYYYFPITRYVL